DLPRPICRSVGARQAAHGEFDPVALERAPAFDLGPVGRLRPCVEPFPRLAPRLRPVEAEGFAHERSAAPAGPFAAPFLNLPPQAIKRRRPWNTRHRVLLTAYPNPEDRMPRRLWRVPGTAGQSRSAR